MNQDRFEQLRYIENLLSSYRVKMSGGVRRGYGEVQNCTNVEEVPFGIVVLLWSG